MKTSKLIAILAMLLVSFSVLATCPTQQTTIFFANGVNADRDGPDGATASSIRLEKELIKESLKDSRVKLDCLTFDLAYNTNEPTFVTDFVEAFIQKSAEFTGVDNFPWAQWQNTVSTTDWFLQAVEKFISIPARGLIESGRWVLGDQRDEHILAYQAEITKGRKVILAAHSQGTLNSREERLALSPTEQSNTKIVGAAAFAFPEPDTSRYTTMDEDKLAIGGLGFSSPPANIFLNLGDSLACQPAVPNPWYCHEFIRSYMGIAPARDKIINDIIALLPTTSSQSGTIIYQPPDSYSLYNESTKLFTAPYCEWLGTEQFSACQFAGIMAFTPSPTTTLGSVQLAIMQQNANDTVTVKVCTTMNCTAGTVLDTSTQDLPQLLLTSASGTLNSVNQPVFTFSHSAVLTQNTTYYVQVFPATTQVYICSPYNHSAVPTPLFVVRS